MRNKGEDIVKDIRLHEPCQFPHSWLISPGPGLSAPLYFRYALKQLSLTPWSVTKFTILKEIEAPADSHV